MDYRICVVTNVLILFVLVFVLIDAFCIHFIMILLAHGSSTIGEPHNYLQSLSIFPRRYIVIEKKNLIIVIKLSVNISGVSNHQSNSQSKFHIISNYFEFSKVRYLYLILIVALRPRSPLRAQDFLFVF